MDVAQAGRERSVSLAGLFPGARFVACDDIHGGSFQDVARRCRPGDVFVARGPGHEQVPIALARGVRGVVAERIIATDGVPLCLVADVEWAWSRLAHTLAGAPAGRMRVTAITGTSGKTTTAWLAAAMLAEGGHRVGVLSDLGCLSADDTPPEPADYADPRAFAGWLARLADGGCTHAVVEVSSRMLAAHALAGVACDTVAVTNLAEAHLDLHGSRQAYRAVTRRIMDGLAADGCLVSGVRPAERDRFRARGPASATCLTAGLTARDDVWARPVERSLHGRTFLLGCGGQMVPVATGTPALPFVRDAVLAAAIAVRHGVALEIAARGLEAVGSVPGRMERIDRGQDVPVFIDTPSSTHALVATLRSLRRLTRGRLAIVAEGPLAARLGGRSFGRHVARFCDDCVVVPVTMTGADPEPADLAAYARMDRLLASLGRHDCLVAVGGAAARRTGPAGPDPFPLAVVVDGWMQLAHGSGSGARRAA